MSVEKFVQNYNSIEKPPYSILANHVVQNIRDAETLAVWVYLSSMPSEWIISRKQLRDHFTLGERKIDKIMSNLKKLGLLEYSQEKGPDGKFKELTANILCGSQFTGTSISAPAVSAPAQIAVHINKDIYKENTKETIVGPPEPTSQFWVLEGTPGSETENCNAYSKSEAEKRMDKFWAEWPRKSEGKAKARQILEKVNEKQFNQIMDGLSRYKTFIEHTRKSGFNRDYMTVEKFLNLKNQRFLDTWAIEKPTSTPKSIFDINFCGA